MRECLRLGVTVSGKSLAGRRWQEYVAAFLARNQRCHLCGELIDLTLRSPDPMSGSVDHLQPVSRGGARWDPANHRAAHRLCNMRRGTKLAPLAGNPSRAW